MSNEYYKSVRREPSLISYWRLNDSAGTKALDWAGKYNINGIYDGSPISGPSMIVGDNSSASKVFGGAAQNVEIPNAEPLQITSDMSIETWILSYKNSSLSNFIFNKRLTNFPSPYFLKITEGKPSFFLGNGESSASVISPSIISINTPYYIVGTLFRKKMYIYVNGTLMATGNLGSQELKDSKEPAFIGARSNGSERFEGLISELAIYNKALSERKIKEHYSIGKQIIYNKPYYTTFNRPSYM